MTPGQLVKAMSIALNIPEETVIQHDRNLAVAGLRTMSARGRNAPHVTSLDAARLLVATLGSFRTKDSVETIRIYEATECEPFRSLADKVDVELPEDLPAWMKELVPRGPDTRNVFDPAILALPPSHNFVEGIAALILDASGPVDDMDRHLQRFSVFIIECGPSIRGSMGRIMHLESRDSAIYNRRSPKASFRQTDARRQEEPRYRRWARHFGTRQTREIYGSAIMLLGKAFRNGGLPFDSTREAVNALLDSEKAPAKTNKRVA